MAENGEQDAEEKLIGASEPPKWEGFVCGWIAGFINVGLTYPMHKTMVRQMLDGITAAKAVAQLRKEGFILLYRGVLPPLVFKTLSVSTMFGSYQLYGNLLREYFPSINLQASKHLGAALAGLSEIIFSQPFERVQTLLQDRHYNKKLYNSYHAVRYIYKSYGLTEFYRGTSPVILRNTSSSIIYFALRDKVQNALPRPNKHQPITRYMFDFLSGAVIGATTSTFVYPLNVIKTRMQSHMGGKMESPLHVYSILIEERKSFRALYRGAHLNYTRSFLSWGIITASYELIKSFIDKHRISSSAS